MRYYLCLLLLLAAACRQAPEKQPTPVTEDSTFLTGTFFLVRHAEKNPGPDSTLTAAGHERARRLQALLQDSGLQKIYFTPFKRTVQTADPLVTALHLDTVFYRPDTTGESLIYEITRHGDWGKRLLIIGHSNTLLPMLHALKANPRLDSIGAQDYGNVFVVYKRSDKVTVKRIMNY
jgi:phosphohistidine phosphatase SixA